MAAWSPDPVDPEVAETVRELHRLQAGLARVRRVEGPGGVWGDKLLVQVRACVEWLRRHGITA